MNKKKTLSFTPKRIKQLLLFLAVGLPAFALAVPGNYLLVERLGIPKSLAYALMLVMQVSMNYLMCKIFVFKNARPKPWYREFAAFFSGIALIRLLDWCFYVVLVHSFGVYYLLAQLINVAIFSVLKFLFSERVMQGATLTP
jgi:putative flippase GtrA